LAQSAGSFDRAGDGTKSSFGKTGRASSLSSNRAELSMLKIGYKASAEQVMYNLSSHKSEEVREILEAAGASLLYLPPYSPDFNPIEQAFAKVKAHLRKAAERSIPALWDRIGAILDTFSAAECRNFFSHDGYA
jgi:transposase